MRKLIRKFFGNPVYVVGTIGFLGFLIDMLVKPISNAGLILLALASSPWLTRLIKSAKLPGVELEFVPSAPPASTGERLAEELSLSPDNVGTPTDPTVGTDPAQPIPGSAGLLLPPTGRLAEAYLAEGLVLQELQREAGGFLQKEVELGSYDGKRMIIDALITGGATTLAVEVKLYSNMSPTQAVIDQLVSRFSHVPHELRQMGLLRPTMMIAIVTVEQSKAWKQVLHDWKRGEADRARRRANVQFRHFHLPDLLSKYGFPTGNEQGVAPTSGE